MKRIVSGKIPPAKLKKVSQPSRKTFRPTGSQRMSWGVLGVATVSLWGNSSPGEGEMWSWLMALINPCYH